MTTFFWCKMGTSQSGPCADGVDETPTPATVSRESGVNDLISALAALDRRLKAVETVAGTAISKLSERLDAIDTELKAVRVEQARVLVDLKSSHDALTAQLREMGDAHARAQVKQRAMIAMLHDDDVSPVPRAAAPLAAVPPVAVGVTSGSGVCHLGGSSCAPLPRRKMR